MLVILINFLGGKTPHVYKEDHINLPADDYIVVVFTAGIITGILPIFPVLLMRKWTKQIGFLLMYTGISCLMVPANLGNSAKLHERK